MPVSNSPKTMPTRSRVRTPVPEMPMPMDAAKFDNPSAIATGISASTGQRYPGVSVQEVPFQRAMRTLPEFCDPTAHAFPAATTTSRRTLLPARLGPAAQLQRRPFQCRIKGVLRPLLSLAPTAQALSAETVVTPNKPAVVPGLGLAACLQCLPSQRKTRDLVSFERGRTL